MVIPVVVLSLRPPKNTLVLVEIATRGEVQGKPFGVVPAAGVIVSPSNTGANPPTKYLPTTGGASGVGGVLQIPAPPLSFTLNKGISFYVAHHILFLKCFFPHLVQCLGQLQMFFRVRGTVV